MIFTCALFFALAFVTQYLPLEVGAIAAFTFGVFLLVSVTESKVGIGPSADGMRGPVRFTVSSLEARGWRGGVTLVPSGGEVKAEFATANSPDQPISVEAYGSGLVASYRREMGDFADRGVGFVQRWLPRVLVDGLGLAQAAKISKNGNEVTTALTKPFVRPLCLDTFFAEKVCPRIGCPLVSSIGESLALAEGKRVSHTNCVYDPLSEVATATHRIEKK